jgi:hypothetical protein
MVPHRLKIYTSGIANDQRHVSAAIESRARIAATKSPHAAGMEITDVSSGDSTPVKRKLSPMNRNACEAREFSALHISVICGELAKYEVQSGPKTPRTYQLC